MTDDAHTQRDRKTHDYFRNVADARYVLRRVFRIAEEQARQQGIDPLKHQALIQIFGSDRSCLRVSELAERLDISPAFTSNLVRELVDDGFATRLPDPSDQRAILVSTTDKAMDALKEIDAAVEFHVGYFAAQIPEEARRRAMETLKLYVGFA